MKLTYTNEHEVLGLTVEEAAKILNIGRNTAYTGVKTGEIPSIKVCGRIVVPKAALLKKLEQAGTSREG